MMEAKKDEIRNSPEAVDINSMMGAWDQSAMGMAMPKTSRPDVYEREYIKALSPYRSKFEIEHREWLGAKAMSDAEESLKFDIGNVLDASSLMQSQPIVSQNAAGIPVFNPMTDEEKEIQKQFQKSVSPPSPSDGEKAGSMTSVQERDRSMT